MTHSKTIIVLGGGIGGIVTASELKKKLGSQHRVILVEKESQYVFSPSFLWLMVGARTPEQISRPMRNVTKRGVELFHGEVEHIDPLSRTVTVNGQLIQSDYIVVALGAELDPTVVPGLSDAGHNLYSLQGAIDIREKRQSIRRGNIAVVVSSMPFKCPAAPYEAAMLLESDCRKRGIRDAVSIQVYSPEPGPMPVAGPVVSDQVRGMLAQKNIQYFPQHAVQSVDPRARAIQFSNGVNAEFDFLIYVPTHKSPKVVRDSGLTGESGWIPVDKKSLKTRFPGVFAIGDVTGIMLASGKPLPKAGVFAHGHAEAVVQTIVSEISGQGDPGEYSGNGQCFVETGGSRAGIGRGNFYAEPLPEVAMQRPSFLNHLGKVIFEKYWLHRWY